MYACIYAYEWNILTTMPFETNNNRTTYSYVKYQIGEQMIISDFDKNAEIGTQIQKYAYLKRL